MEVIRAQDGSVTRSSVWANVPLAKGDVVRFMSGSGGGYGDPRQRPAAMVLEDWENEFITAEEAQTIYGVRIDTERGAVDEGRYRSATGLMV